MTPNPADPLLIAATDPAAKAVASSGGASASGDEGLLKEIREMNRLLALNVRAQTGIKERVLAGLFTGLGTVIGATVVIGLIARLLAPLAKAEVVGPYIEKIQSQLEKPKPGQGSADSSDSTTDGSAPKDVHIRRLDQDMRKLDQDMRRLEQQQKRNSAPSTAPSPSVH